ncbi:Alpha/beta hydrolase family, putative [Angomonas deanei]|uniref:Alpha/beta hydrolase family, putative n=1 Tax=Angomonas deanei TaxID=59799 RepID=A0A7G2CP67_9TRYP|nr:Alpha/beta hydrolase family, putative [Angomonas deanei]
MYDPLTDTFPVPPPDHEPLPPDEYVNIGYCPSAKRRINLCYNVFGKEKLNTVTENHQNIIQNSKIIVLVMGLGCPGVYWDGRMCDYLQKTNVEELIPQGENKNKKEKHQYAVLRYDNRDVGLSTHLDEILEPQEVKEGKKNAQNTETAVANIVENNLNQHMLSHPMNPVRTAIRSVLPNTSAVQKIVPTFVKGALPYTLEDMTRDLFLFLLRLHVFSEVGEEENPTKEVHYNTSEEYYNALRQKKFTNNGNYVHLVGTSMGGMILQLIGARYNFVNHAVQKEEKRAPSTTLFSSMTLMSSCARTPLPSSVSGASKMLVALLDKAEDVENDKNNKHLSEEELEAKRAAAYIDYKVRFMKFICGDRLYFPEADVRKGLSWAVTRTTHDTGRERQLAAIASAPDRRALLSVALNTPRTPYLHTLVLHGGSDPIIPLAYGQELAKLIRHAKMVILPSMGHYFPPCTFVAISNHILIHAREAERRFAAE